MDSIHCIISKRSEADNAHAKKHSFSEIMQNDQEKAAAVAMDISKRRASGEVIRDADVLSRYPELAEPIQRELNKLRVIHAMRDQADIEENEFDPAIHHGTA